MKDIKRTDGIDFRLIVILDNDNVFICDVEWYSNIRHVVDVLKRLVIIDSCFYSMHKDGVVQFFDRFPV